MSPPLFLLLLACGSAESFIAMQADFADFLAWERIVVEGGVDVGHGAASKSVYLNGRPPERATSWPVGTIIVKVAPTEDGREIHAMAKRGEGYNRDGAVGWEWFELALDEGEPVIAWRGTAPPDGQGYGQATVDTASPEVVDCNACHRGAAATDFTWTVAP